MADDGSQQRKPDFRTAVKDVKALSTVLAMEAQAILGRRTARVLGALALFAAVVGILVWYIAPSGAAEKQALVVTLAQILGGTALLSGLYFTWHTLQVNREGQITDRFTRAIDQLGKTDETGNRLFEIRLGGIHALERIARESEEDYWPIMEVLTAYVRQHAPSSRPEEGHGGDADSVVKAKSVEDSNGEFETTEVPTPDPDIQAIITVLWRRTRSYGHGEPDILDLHETNLARANLPGANLSRADLAGTNLSGADLSDAALLRTNLSDTYLLGANLSGANLSDANLSGAYLSPEERSDDPNTQTRLVYISPAQHLSANRQRRGTEETSLYVGNLSDADLSGATLWGANFSGACLTQAQLDDTIGDEETQLPPNLRPPAHWDVKTDEQIEGE